MSKYKSLWEYVQKREDMPLKLTFEEIKGITGGEFDHSFLKYKKELTEYGYEAKKISLKGKFVVFDKICEQGDISEGDTMDKVIIYIHGNGGNAEEAEHYKPLFESCDVIGFDYTAQSPWEAKEEFPRFFDAACRNYKSAVIVASSIGAFFAMNTLADRQIERAYFISPVVDMERLIADMMTWANVTEAELREKKEIPTEFGETLSWEYLCYVRNNPIAWTIPTDILYGEKDNLTSYETMSEFANKVNASLTVMRGGEHWFHTKEQMEFLDDWILRSEKMREAAK